MKQVGPDKLTVSREGEIFCIARLVVSYSFWARLAEEGDFA